MTVEDSDRLASVRHRESHVLGCESGFSDSPAQAQQMPTPFTLFRCGFRGDNRD